MVNLKRFISTGIWFFWVSILLSLLLHLPFVNEPPSSTHVWRQANTLAMARNLYMESMNVIEPRVDCRYDTPGITGSQFPSYEFILALLYHVFGEQFWIARLVSFVLYGLTAWGIYKLTYLITQNNLFARVSFWITLWCPLLFYYGFTALPDTLALPLSVWGTYFTITWFNNYLSNAPIKLLIIHYLSALLLLILAGLTKIQFLAVGFPILIYILQYIKNLKSINIYLALLSFGALIVITTVGWYLYAIKLIETSGLADFGLAFRPVTEWGVGLSIISQNIFSDIPESILNFSSFALLLLGFYASIKRKTKLSFWFYPILIWIMVLIAYHIIELNQMKHHDYYMMPYIPVLVLIAAYGAMFIHKKGWVLVLFILMAIQPVLASVRILPARWLSSNKFIPIELYNEEPRRRLAMAVPDDRLCIVGVDESKCIYFYYLNKKGFGISSVNELTDIQDNNKYKIEDYINRGAKYIYIDSDSLLHDQLMNKFIDKIILKEGRFIVASLKVENNEKLKK